MSEDEINRAIAEHLGWKWHDHPDTLKKTEGWTLPNSVALNPDGELVSPHSVPNYSRDLNAMHEAEKTLSDKEHDRFRSQLWLLLVNVSKASERARVERRVHSAESHERAEAFLRTVGKWKEDE